MKELQGKRVYVGLSGGVDSAVSAALLLQAGADVTGVFIKGWYPPGMPCTWAAERRDAMRVAASLHIPFHTLDASAEYKKGVIDYLLSEYEVGRTPNPDVMCNKEVKFGAFYEFARVQGANYIATGHYAQQVDGKLLRGPDESKDQSYFLWAISPDALAHTLFPVGGLPKTEVRRLAKHFRIPVAEKRDSQGICFLGSVSVDEFLRKEFEPIAGNALDQNGNKVGTHDGAVLYTLGARATLHNAEQGPWYVVSKDMLANTVTVSKDQFTAVTTTKIRLRDTNFFAQYANDTQWSEELTAQYRYHGPRIEGVFDFDAHTFAPSYSLQEIPASGQSLVLYKADECIGGGIIV